MRTESGTLLVLARRFNPRKDTVPRKDAREVTHVPIRGLPSKVVPAVGELHVSEGVS